MPLFFEWDEVKARKNLGKHKVDFAEATSVFGDPLSLTIVDPDHPGARERRYVTIGISYRHRILVIVHLEEGERIRIISSRSATKQERKAYEKGC